MSWASVVQNAKAIKPLSTDPKRVVVASEPTKDSGVKITSNEVGFAAPLFERALLILDANAFIKGTDSLDGSADVLVTTTQVVSEVRDQSARQRIQNLPVKLHLLEPTRASLERIIEIAEKTGDFGTMSRTDIRLCALALDCCIATGTLMKPIAPRASTINPTVEDGTVIVSEVQEGEGEINEGKGVRDGDSDDRVEDGHSSDDEGWITPENIHQHVVGGEFSVSGERFTGGVACVTSDFAMQNTLLHAGVPIIGPNGMRIQELRQWLLRCTACFTINTDTTRQFCIECGSGDTLRRVQYVVTRDGQRQLFINFRKQISTRGTVYNLPKPRGGKKGTNRHLVLREDQLAHVLRGTTSSKMREKFLFRGSADGGQDDLAAFGISRPVQKRDPNEPRLFSSYHKYNVNERKKARAGKRK
ncbi:PIN domain [Trypanosoma vivax]|uniref:RNA-binding protein NOB1 n=1 Tax=Trypanosoma vivax (strain Y486) TaxID=1055687 RepID=G0UCY5_TRYVY|nr:PIN domain [Trypanosoma vivax]CCC53695.1 conserved hypothetical protein [Trypanosoma vivax Y486]